ncbi:MAG: electron transfer flavoprotein subunit alpha/FixB family protein [Desulfobacula sp.]|jgi:electron transfer flavoprotein alpha subunit
MTINIWVWLQHREGDIEPESLGLIREAVQMISKHGISGTITALAFGAVPESALAGLGEYGVHNIIYSPKKELHPYQGEVFACILHKLVQDENPSLIYMVQTAQTADLAPRLAALTGSALVTRAMDFKITENYEAIAVRPRSNGYLFERLSMSQTQPPIVCFNPSVLTLPEPGKPVTVNLVQYQPKLDKDSLKTRLSEIIEASGQDLDLEEADTIVAGGRGAGDEEQFKLIHELADLLGAPVGGTRPVIDSGILPYECQIGQTGKIVTPRLLINCGISGANEYTAGIEKSKVIISINTDERARIFNFSDLGLVGDSSSILPIVIDRIKKLITS